MAKKNNEVKQKNSYFKGMKQELKKVVWPTPKELINNAVAVIVFVIIIGLIVFVLDFGFDNINKYGITKLQEKIQTSFQTTEDSENEEDDNGVALEEDLSEDSTNVDESEVVENTETESSEESSSEQENTESNEEKGGQVNVSKRL